MIIKANPIALPTIEISELYFDNSGNWKLELQYCNYDFIPTSFDSVFIYSSTDTAKIPSNFFEFETTIETAFIIITKDSLNSEFNIDKFGNTLKVATFYSGYPIEDILIFGNATGALINYPRQGQSICKYNHCFVKDNSPTLGVLNDTSGICGILKGTIYDKYSENVNNRIFYIDNLVFETSSKGEFKARVLSKPSVFDYIIYQWISQGITFGISASITEISYVMEPDSVVELDIYLLDTLATGINDINVANTPISVYPNPISKSEKLKINIDLPVITSEIYIEIIDLNGKLINKKKIGKNSSSIVAPDKSGYYIVRTLLDSEVISSNRFIVNE